jgi:Cu2+-containing amine oxidase
VVRRPRTAARQPTLGWYRYISDWRLRNDGSIGPRFGFTGTLNPCTCQVHTHHVYLRLDFDIITAGNNVVEEYNNPPIVGSSNWHTKRFEIRRPRDASHQRHWRVRNKGTFRGYSILPGSHDGTADASYGLGDVWVLRYHGNEIDDGQGFTSNPADSRVAIDKFINGKIC